MKISYIHFYVCVGEGEILLLEEYEHKKL